MACLKILFPKLAKYIFNFMPFLNGVYNIAPGLKRID